ncbi:DUF1579 domain-containing protein [candidate division KSB1 bacterium]|nr:DUF1579 domain-containing protein [candidate division KSB1 bacterium]
MFSFFRSFRFAVVATAIVAATVSAPAQDKQPSPEEMQKMMEACKELGTPGAEHAALAKMVGNWDCSSKMWMDPAQPPMESKGSCIDKMILGGRVVHSEFTGDMMGQPYHGIGMTGYDKFRKLYWMSWNDDFGTGISTAEGTGSPDGKTITMLGKMDDPMMNLKDKPVKYVMTLIDDNNHKFEMYDAVGTPKEFKVMEIHYKRK